MKYLNHYTVNINNNRKSLPKEVSKKTFEFVSILIEKAMIEEYVKVIDDIYMKLTVETPNTYVCTLYIEYENELYPILITSGCNSKDDAAYTINALSETYYSMYGKKMNIIPMIPFVTDIILPTNEKIWMRAIKAYEWTGDFCKCLGWVVLS